MAQPSRLCWEEPTQVPLILLCVQVLATSAVERAQAPFAVSQSVCWSRKLGTLVSGEVQFRFLPASS